jgi:hypothetical protein
MPIEDFLRSTVGLVTGISALVASLAALVKALVDLRRESRAARPGIASPAESASLPAKSQNTSTEPREASPITILLKNTFFAVSVALALVAVIILVPRFFLRDKPSVTIVNPASGDSIEVRRIPTGSGMFEVSGSSSAVFENPDLRIYVLVHPSAPSASGWWIQKPAGVDATGSWYAECWIGDPKFPPQAGNRVDIVSIAAKPSSVEGKEHVNDPKDLMPAAQSGIVRFYLGTIR